MRIAVISDIHGNAVAFDAALADIERQGADRVVCLGDAIQGGPQPAEVVARLRALGCPVVMGNADDFLLTGQADDGEPITEQQRLVRAWGLTRLSEADRAFITAFQPTVGIDLPAGRRLLCFHGSPASFNDLIFPETPQDEVRRLLDPRAAALFTGGHTHLQQLRRLDDALFFNPGSVGLAYDRNQPAEDARVDPWAEYAIVTADDAQLGIEFRRVPFDVEVFRQVIRACGIPGAADMAGRYGRDE
jgi:predicted phosphodiesterase